MVVKNSNIVNAVSLTRSELNALQSSSGIIPGLIYVISDESRLAVGLSSNAYESYAKESEAGGTNFIVHDQSDLAINGANGNFFNVSLSANASLTYSNMADGHYYVRITNTHATSDIVITLPPGNKPATSFYVACNGYQAKNIRMLSITIYDGNAIFTISEELSS